MRASLLAALLFASAASAQTLTFDADVPDDGSPYMFVNFEVPAGTQEIEVRHDDQSADNILDWGVDDPNGYRGWGGGNTEPAIIGEQAASRSYLPGPMTPGTWRVVIGKAKIVTAPAHYHIEVDLRTTPTLAPQTERKPYLASPPLKTEARYYSGDFHVHSIQSGDAKPTIDTITQFAKSRGLDFVALSDHNTVAQLDYIVDAQSRSPDVLLIPSVEYTTYAGHANGIGATHYVDYKLGGADGGITEAVKQFHDMGALFSVNHPSLDLGTLCIGCAWRQKLARDQIDAVEIETGGYSQAGIIFLEPSIRFWETVLQTKPHTPAIGGSDDHRGGASTDPADSPIGSPTTLVFATELSAAGILDGIRAGHTVVKTQGPEDPMVELSSGTAIVGDTVHGDKVTLKAVVTGGSGQKLRLVKNGTAMEPVAVDADPFTYQIEVLPPPAGQEDRYRAEVLVSDKPRTITSHLYVAAALEEEPKGCGCGAAPGALIALGALLFAVQRSKRKRTPNVA